MKLKKHIPNAITCCNLLCGCFGILVASSYQLDFAFYFLIAAAVFDFFDGFAARILKVSSNIGKDLDSLADMVTFGVLPGFIMYKMLVISIINYSNNQITMDLLPSINFNQAMLASFESMGLSSALFLVFPFLGFLIPVFSAIRLAKFNNDTRQTTSFIGLPTPANGMLISSLGYIFVSQIHKEPFQTSSSFIFNPYSLIALTLLLCYLLNAEIPLFALKFKSFTWKDNKIRFIFLGISLILLIALQWIAIPLLIILYVLFSLIAKQINKE